MWILIPLAGIFAGMFSEWLKFREKQIQLGNSADHLKQEVDALRSALDKSTTDNKALIERIQNLETIVTSVEWDQLNTSLESEEGGVKMRPSAVGRIELGSDAESTATDAAKIARRLKI